MFKIIALTLVLSTIGAISSEMYIPSMPYITAWFNTTDTTVQYSFTAYMLGSILPALFFGTLADIYGRKRIILIALSIGLVATIGCLFATSIWFFIACRFIQGFGYIAVLMVLVVPYCGIIVMVLNLPNTLLI